MTADVNHGLIVQVLAQIEREPRLWQQSTYGSGCRTAHCFAGWAVTLTQPEIWNRADTITGYEISLAADKVLGIRGWRDVDGDPDNPHGMLYHTQHTMDDLYRISARWMGVDESVLRDKVREEI